MSLKWEDSRPERKVVVCLPDPFGEKLAVAIKGKLGLDVIAVDDPMDELGASEYILDVDRGVIASELSSSGARVAVVTSKPVTAEERASVEPADILSGALPGVVFKWLDDERSESKLEWSPSAEDGPPSDLVPMSRHESVVVFSSAGGVGKTTTSVEIAAGAADAGLRTCLIELDEDRRGVLTYFDSKPKRGIDDLQPSDWMDDHRFAEAMRNVVVRAGRNLSVVPMLGTLHGMQYQDNITHDEDYLPTLFRWASRNFDLAVYDMPARIRDHVVISAIRDAKRIVFVVEPTEITVNTAKGYLTMLKQIGDSHILNNMALLVNRVPSKRWNLPSDQISEALGIPLLGEVALNAELYMGAINRHEVPQDPAWDDILRELDLVEAVEGPKVVRPNKKKKKRRGFLGLFGG